MVILKIKIPEHLRSKSKAPLSPSKPTTDTSKPLKKIRERGSAHGKVGKRTRWRNCIPPRYDSDVEQSYADQCNRCAVSALTHFNEVAASKMGVTYELVEAGSSTGFMHAERGCMYHFNFLAKPTNCVDDSETMLFFGELWKIYPLEPQVTNCCILGSAGTVCLGNNGCEACGPKLHHPAEGFYVGDQQFLLY